MRIGKGTGTIRDNDEAPPTLSIDDVTVDEGDGSAEFKVTLSVSSARDVTVRYATSNGTARAGQDYTATSGTLTIAAGDTSGTISVRVFDDDVVEEDETFTVSLSSPTNATIADGKATGTIRNDDEALPTLSIADVAVDEGDGSAAFEVTLSAPSAT